MATTLVGIYHSICGKENYLNSVNILQTMAVAVVLALIADVCMHYVVRSVSSV